MLKEIVTKKLSIIIIWSTYTNIYFCSEFDQRYWFDNGSTDDNDSDA